MNEDIERIFNRKLVIGTSEIPVEFGQYDGEKEDYIVYNGYDEPYFEYENDIQYIVNVIEFNVYTKGNFLEIIKVLKQKLKENNYDWTGDSQDLYETETKYHHKVCSFEKIRRN